MTRQQVVAAAMFGYCAHAVLDRLEGVRPMDSIIFPALIMIAMLVLLVVTDAK
jgi:hypothetical protein